VRVVPLTPDLWPAFEDLLSQGGPCSRCWCMYWRIGPGYHKRKPDTNRSAFQALVLSGPPPGLVALSGNVSLGWCQLTPRDALPWLDRVGKLRRVDNEPVWSVSCFYVRKGHRKKGLSRRLLEAAIETARRNRVRLLEAYPLDARLTQTSSYTGYVSTFLRSGFKVVARHAPTQPIMRLAL
jgi:GNAT superfamily N-acetyltransferase